MTVKADYEVWSAEVRCPECGTPYTYLVESPPIPMLVRGFVNEEGRRIGDSCWCGEELPVPKEAP